MAPYTGEQFLSAVAALPPASLPLAQFGRFDLLNTDGLRGFVVARLSNDQLLGISLVLTAKGWQVTSLDRPAGPGPQR